MNPRVLGPNAGAALCTCRATTNQISAQDAPSNSGSFDCGILFPVGLEGARRTLTYKSVRLSATDISALASMKNVAKCDTWCELQNPANHRVFERKLRPRPFGRGHICLGVKQLVSRRLPPCRLRARSLSEMRVGWAESGRPCACSACGWLKSPGHGLRAAQRVVVVRSQGRDCQHAAPFASRLPGKYPTRSRRPIHGSIRIATPSQVGLPAELKHINKRRRRNLRGFP